MNRRSFLGLFGAAAVAGAVNRKYFFAPRGGWDNTAYELSKWQIFDDNPFLKKGDFKDFMRYAGTSFNPVILQGLIAEQEANAVHANIEVYRKIPAHLLNKTPFDMSNYFATVALRS